MLSSDDCSITKTVTGCSGTVSISSCRGHPGVIYEENAGPPSCGDVEKDSAWLRHVLLDVQGLTCTGCEAKLYRALTSLPGIYNVRTSLVLCQAEFDLNDNAGSVDEVTKSVTRLTGFTCQRLGTEGQEIDVIVDTDALSLIHI